MRTIALLLLATQAACIAEMPPPPTTGYGAPYHGTGEPIFVKDSRNDWAITEGSHSVSSEQALEATGDKEYETRRQEMKRYNDKLYSEAKWHRRWGHTWMFLGFAAVVGGVALAYAHPTTMDSTLSAEYTYGGYGTALLGTIIYYYARARGGVLPPYVDWHTPGPLNRPAYVRQLTEPYNVAHGVKPAAEQPGGVDTVAPPGQRHLRMRRPK